MKKIVALALAFNAAFLLSSSAASAQEEPFRDTALSFEMRAADLLSRLSLDEKVALMMDVSKPVERLGIRQYNWWNESLHGVARAGIATVFPQPIGMAASFDTGAVFRVFNAVSDEARAKHSRFVSGGTTARYQGLTMWTPNVNIYRDPRWGRGIETYGEDPFLTAAMGVAVATGLQGPAGGKYDKLHACAKHFAVHSGPEWNRHSFNAADVSLRDLHETYLPAFESLVKDAQVKEVMCAYNRFEGAPCCGSDKLLTQILRRQWGFKGIVVADCGAIADFYNEKGHHTHADAATASAAAVRSGTDLDCGSSYKALIAAVRQGAIDASEIDTSVKRLLTARFALGEMDAPAAVSWNRIPYDVVASRAHDTLALQMARESMTLLQNKGNLLPLKPGRLSIAVIGPNANDSVMQWGNYNGTPERTTTILAGIKAVLGKGDRLIYEPGCDLVERTVTKSIFGEFASEKGAGFTASYWNNTDRSGVPVAAAQLVIPPNFCTAGGTVFAPGVNLTNFSASYRSVLHPTKSGAAVFSIMIDGELKLFVNDSLVLTTRTSHGSRKVNYVRNVTAGKSYAVRLECVFRDKEAQLTFDPGFKAPLDIAAISGRVRSADVVVFVGGLSPLVEGEEMPVDLPGFRRGDRTDIELPAVQRELLKALAAAGKKIVLVNCSGSALGLEPETKSCAAILQAWYPGQSGGTAVADVLFGKYNPAGRLPVTFYRNAEQLPDFENYSMAGRTYRYLQQAPLFPFGFGLSYTQFRYSEPELPARRIGLRDSLRISVSVTNTGRVAGDEVVQVYLGRDDDKSGPVKTLRAFRRVSIPAGKTLQVPFVLTPGQLQWWDDEAKTMTNRSGRYTISIGRSSADEDVRTVPVDVL